MPLPERREGRQLTLQAPGGVRSTPLGRVAATAYWPPARPGPPTPCQDERARRRTGGGPVPPRETDGR